MEKRYWVWCDSCGAWGHGPKGVKKEKAAALKREHDKPISREPGHPKAELRELR